MLRISSAGRPRGRRWLTTVPAITVALAGALAVAPAAGASIALGSVVSANPADTTPNIADGAVYKMLPGTGSTMFVGGQFTSVTSKADGKAYSRSNLFSFNTSTGALTTLAPTFDDEVWALASDGTSLFVGGNFTTVSGQKRRGIVKLNATTGAVDPTFDAKIGGNVTEAQVLNGRLIVGGTFPKKLAALNLTTGADTGYINLGIDGQLASNSGRTQVYRFSINPAGTKLAAVGNFTTVSGQTRKKAFVADLGTSSATLNAWYYAPLGNSCVATIGIPDNLRDVDFSPAGDYFVLVSTGGQASLFGGLGRDICDAAARFDINVTNPAKPVWINYTGGDTLHSVAVTDKAVYVQGHQRWLDNYWGQNVAGPGAVSREGIGAIDPATGKALSWNPGKARGVGGKDLLVTAQGLWVGSDTSSIGGETHSRIAFFPKA